MGIYDVTKIEQEIERVASEHEGEIPQELLQELVEAEMKSMESIEKMCRYVRHLEQFVTTCKDEKERINTLQKQAETRLDNVKKYMQPYVSNRGKFNVGTFKLSTRKSEFVVLSANFNDQEYCKEIIEIKPDKKRIKEALKSGTVIKGATLMSKENLQIK